VTHRNVFTVEPWQVREDRMHLDLLAETESIFALSNGHVGVRGNLDEGEPNAIPGTYLNGFYEDVPLPYAERGYGYPEEGQTLIDVTNGKVIRLLVDDEPFDIRYGTLRTHERALDLRDGVLRREVEWLSPAGQAARIRSTRLVSFVQRSILAIHYEVEPLDQAARIVVQSALVTNEPVPINTDDPRAAAALSAPLVAEHQASDRLGAALGHRTCVSGLRMTAAMDHEVDGPDGTVTTLEVEPDLARLSVSTELEPGQRLRLVKYVAYGWSGSRTTPAVRDQVDAALAAATRTGWDGLRAGQREYLDEFWDHADVEIDGDDALQQALRFTAFQVLQASARAEQRAIPAKGLTGRGYDGHAFWDTEAYSLRMLTYTMPDSARDALLWRHGTLELARARASHLGLSGATFPWRTIAGGECSGYWPAGTAGMHVNADIADAVRRYVSATGDEEFESGAGLDLLVETARLWCSVGHHDSEGAFRIDGVTGPDEYSALADNNVFTNLMAARNLRAAADAAAAFPQEARARGVDEREIADWCRAADAMTIPFDTVLGVTAQADGFTRYREWDFDSLALDDRPLLLRYPYFSLYASQVVKQADLVLALYACGDHFEDAQKARDFAYYEPITVRDSSLSASIQAIVAAEIGALDLADDYLQETAFVDLHGLNDDTVGGVHLAASAGAWLAVVAGFGGMRDHGPRLEFAPRLPTRLTSVTFRLRYRGRRLRVGITHRQATYELVEGDALEVSHHGEDVVLRVGQPQTRGWDPLVTSVALTQPPGRPPGRRRPEAERESPESGERQITP
jgi:alpha,alpha-trehalose phosphorylase